ncbi:hypothetical protein WT83_01975 [Burkholderia territorii]|uniref:Uncharacterized protein n=1 Tax=Burkholderia territorii TaxID=1503055 RepID=A0A108F6U8_9BURK|nr:hypothetical protein WT83_01975 [Burkholderia territorii]
MKCEGNDEAIPSTAAMPGCSLSLAIEPARTVDAPKQSEEEREWRSGNANGRAMRARSAERGDRLRRSRSPWRRAMHRRERQ